MAIVGTAEPQHKWYSTTQISISYKLQQNRGQDDISDVIKIKTLTSKEAL
jgi:hypothetical protein